MAVLKILELVGTSKESWSDGAREAVNEAAKTVRGIETVEVVHSKAVVQNSRLTEYQVQVRIGFRIERAPARTSKKKAKGLPRHAAKPLRLKGAGARLHASRPDPAGERGPSPPAAASGGAGPGQGRANAKFHRLL